MIKKIAFSIFLLFTSYVNSAQEIDIGPKLGANFSTHGDLLQFDNQIGFVAGAFLNIKFESIGIQPELLYSQQGQDFEFSAFDLDYINLPLMFKFYFSGDFNFQIGPQLGVLVNDNIPDSIVQSIDTETFDLTGVVGLGVELPFKIYLSVRYIFDVENDLQTANFGDGFFTLALGVSLF
jgi:hypothetical protein